MRYQIIGKNMEISERTREKVASKLSRIEKFFPEETIAVAVLKNEKLGSRIEVTIPLNKRIIRAEVSEGDLMAAVDGALDILENQVVRYKKRLHTKLRQSGEAYRKEYEAVPVPEDTLSAHPDSPYLIDRVKHFEVKPMDPEEAIMEMDMIGHSFFVFRNGQTDAINVVYRRNSGSYGLIEPEA